MYHPWYAYGMTSSAYRPRLSGPSARTASPKAAAFWTSLRADLVDLITELVALGEGTTIIIPVERDPLPADECSAEIDEMLDDVRSLRATVREARRLARERDVPTSAGRPDGGLEADRLYETPDGEVYRTVRSGQGSLYAKIWTGEGWEYAAGAIRDLRPEHRMTRERAIELSTRWARCIRCGAELTAALSVERGIGPVCITKI